MPLRIHRRRFVLPPTPPLLPPSGIAAAAAGSPSSVQPPPAGASSRPSGCKRCGTSRYVATPPRKKDPRKTAGLTAYPRGPQDTSNPRGPHRQDPPPGAGPGRRRRPELHLPCAQGDGARSLPVKTSTATLPAGRSCICRGRPTSSRTARRRRRWTSFTATSPATKREEGKDGKGRRSTRKGRRSLATLTTTTISILINPQASANEAPSRLLL